MIGLKSRRINLQNRKTLAPRQLNYPKTTPVPAASICS